MRRLRIELELLEDLHTGTGTGAGDIDALLSRDRDGLPVLRASHVRGVWKDTLPDSALKATLFGKSREASGQLSLTSFHAIADAYKPQAELCWSSTAFQENSRAPAEDSLRTREFVAAGTRFAATAWLPEGLEPTLLQAVTRADALGARRRRGDGVITVAGWEAETVNPGPIEGEPSDETLNLRLLLHAEDPVCLTLTGFPGNILPGECYLRGQQVLGGIVKALLDAGQNEAAQTWLSRQIQVGNAYPVPKTADRENPTVPEGWEQWSVLPIPLAYQRGKPGGSGWQFPWWTESGQPGSVEVKIIDKFAEKSAEKDMSDQAANPAPENAKKVEDEKAKRPGDREFLFREKPEEDGWCLFVSPMGLRMRNALPRDGNRRGGLFTQEEILERTRFLADIQFPDAKTAQKAADCLRPWIGGGRCLNLGRGGAPVVIEAAAWQATPSSGKTASSDGKEGELELLLVSDLIARDRTLAFLENLDLAALTDLCEIKPAELDKLTVDPKSVADTVEVHGFNALTGLPRIPALAMRRGSCWRFTGDAKQLDRLREALQKRLATGLGERRWEGYGAFMLDFHQAIPAGKITRQGTAARKADETLLKTEQAIETAAKLWREYWETHQDHPDEIPRLVHWQRLRGVAQQGPEALKKHLGEMLKKTNEEPDAHAQPSTERKDIQAWAKWLLDKFESHPEIQSDELYRQLLRHARLGLRSSGEAP